MAKDGPKILVIDIETAPIVAYVWALFDQNIGLNQIKSDWHLLSVSAKWLGSSKVLYLDQRNAKPVSNDRKLLQFAWDLMNEADVLLTQNGISFDAKKLNARFILNGMKPPSPYRHIDTLRLARKQFALTSNKLAYMSEQLCTKNRKLSSKRFPGFELWKACLDGNPKAWAEMERYNKADVLALEELYRKLQPWDSTVNLSVYFDHESPQCDCGSFNLIRQGYKVTNAGKYPRLQCRDCGAWMSLKGNLLSHEKRRSLKR